MQSAVERLFARWMLCRPVLRYLIAAVLGGLAALGQAPWDLWPLTVIALALVYGGFQATSSWRSAAMLGVVTGTGYFILALSWIIEPFLVDPVRHGWMAPFAVTLLSFYLAWYWALAFGVCRALGGGAFGFVAAFMLGEVCREIFFTGFPWAQVGHVLIDTPLLYWASWGGSLFLVALIWAAAIAIWHLARGVWIGSAATLTGLGVAFGSGVALTPNMVTPDDAATVRLVQPNAPQHEKWDPDKVGLFFNRQLQFTAAPPADGGRKPDLVVWPETAVPVLLHNADDTLSSIHAAAQGAPAVVGLRRVDLDRIFNTLVYIDQTGQVAEQYDKHHLVPFGEFVPFGDFMARFGIAGLAASAGNGFSSGLGPQVIDMGALGKAAPLICYEGVFARNLLGTPERPDMILMITNDAWFGEISGPYQHLAQGRLRAAEQGLPMVRVANTGISAMVDATGKILDDIQLGEAGFIDVQLPSALPPTFYSRAGDWPAYVLITLVLLSGAVFGRRTRKEIQEIHPK